MVDKARYSGFWAVRIGTEPTREEGVKELAKSAKQRNKSVDNQRFVEVCFSFYCRLREGLPHFRTDSRLSFRRGFCKIRSDMSGDESSQARAERARSLAREAALRLPDPRRLGSDAAPVGGLSNDAD